MAQTPLHRTVADSRQLDGRTGQVRMDHEQRFDAVYRDHASAVIRYLRRRVDRASVEDLAADVFIVVASKLDGVRPGEELPWLYRIAANMVANHHRRTKSDLFDPLASGGFDVQGVGSAPELGEAVAEKLDTISAFSALDEEDRAVLMLAAWEGLDSEELAIALGCTAAAARKRLSRARAHFTALLA